MSQPGYDSVFLQVGLHEISHLMGINDYPPGTDPGPGPSTSGVTSVLGVNDQENHYQKSGPTDCDRQQASSSTSTFAAAANSSNNGGGGGGGGGGRGGEGGGPVTQYYPPDSDPGHPCDWNEYWDASTQTLIVIEEPAAGCDPYLRKELVSTEGSQFFPKPYPNPAIVPAALPSLQSRFHIVAERAAHISKMTTTLGVGALHLAFEM